MRLLILLVFAITLSGLASARQLSQNTDMYSGVWHGTLGQEPITVCFDRDSWGNYYHNQQPELVLIRREDYGPIPESATELRWTEISANNPAPIWVLARISEDNTVSGYRLDPVTHERTPLHLQQRIYQNTAPLASHCDTDLYIAPLETYDLQVTREAPQAFAPGRVYRKLHFSDWQSIELLGDAPGIAAINAHYALSNDREAHDDYYQTRRYLLRRYASGQMVYGEQSIEPLFWSRDFVVIRNYQWPPGYGANGIHIHYKTWDLQTGEEINLTDWLADNQLNSFGQPVLPSALCRHLVRHYRLQVWDDEPVDEVRDCEAEQMFLFSLILRTDGITFQPDNYQAPWRGSAALDFNELQPFLNTQGKAAVARMKAASDFFLPDLQLLAQEYARNEAPADHDFLRQVQDEQPLQRNNVTHYNNIAYHLEQNGHYATAVFLLRDILHQFPQRTVAYINLGDALWAMDRQADAIDAYQTYIRLMRESGREQRIPQRVFERVEPAASHPDHAALITDTQPDTDLPRYLTVTEEQLRSAVDDHSFAVVNEGIIYTFGASDYRIDTSQITDMSELFYSPHPAVASFNEDISYWDVSRVTNMAMMFRRAESFNQPIGQWDVSRVNNMHGMFQQAHSFNQPIEQWNVSRVENMHGMFHEAHSFNQPIGQWDVSRVNGMTEMFKLATSFNQPIGQWVLSSELASMMGMFQMAKSFNQPLEHWEVSRINNMENMFLGAVAFNQPLGQWDVSSAGNMMQMLHGADAFNQDLSTWSLSSDIKRYFKPNDLFRHDYPTELLPSWEE